MTLAELKNLLEGDAVTTERPQLIAMIHGIVFQPKTITGDLRRDLENLVSMLVESLNTEEVK